MLSGRLGDPSLSAENKVKVGQDSESFSAGPEGSFMAL